MAFKVSMNGARVERGFAAVQRILIVLSALPCQMNDIITQLAGGRLDAVRGTDITVQQVWCSNGYQVGTGLDEKGRALVFSLSLSTGEGRAKLV